MSQYVTIPPVNMLYFQRKMALLRLDRIDEVVDGEVRRGLRRERLFRDHSNPLDCMDDLRLYQRFRFDRRGIFDLTELLRPDLERPTNRNRALSPSLQVFAVILFSLSTQRHFELVCG